MTAYFPPTAYERLPDYAEYGVAPAIPQQQQQRPSPQNDQRQRPSSVFSSPTTPTHYFDHEGLLKQQTQYAPPHQPQTSFTPLSHQETAIYTRPTTNQLRHQYRRIKQFRRISLVVFGRWLLSCLLAATIVGLFMRYQNKGVLGGTEKHMFNALYLGVSLLYGLNLVASFKSMALIFRWRVLASTSYGGHSAAELDLILGMSSYGTSTMLLKHWVRKPKYFLLMGGWIFLGIIAQLGVATLGLAFNHDAEGALRLVPGLINATELSVYRAWDKTQWPLFSARNYIAHLYGDTSINLLQRSEGEKLSEDDDPNAVDIVYVNATNEFKYYFVETAYRSRGRDKMSKTKRFVTITPRCVWSPIVNGQVGGDNNTVMVDTGGDGTGNDLTEHPWLYGITGQSTTLYGNPNINANDTEAAGFRAAGHPLPYQPTCGPRCSLTYVYRFIRPEEVVDPNGPYPFGDFFNCSTTVSAVNGAIIPQHMMSDQLARNAAAAIGSSSIWRFSESSMLQGTFQSTTYNQASPWDNWKGRKGAEATSIAEYHVGRFAAGSIAILDTSNPKIEISGMRPEEGVVLDVKWRYVWILWGLLLGTQLLVGIVTVIKGNAVFCKDDSFLSTARLLQPLVRYLGADGSSASGAEIAALFGNTHMRYGVRREAGVNTLDILMDQPGDAKDAHGGMTGDGWPRGYYE